MSLIHTQKELSLFLKEKMKLADFTLAPPLKDEASHRDYYRFNFIGTNQKETQQVRVALNFENEENANTNTISHAVISVNHKKIKDADDFCIIQSEFKKNNITVPEIYRIDHEEGLIWQEDLGDQDLCDIIHNTCIDNQEISFNNSEQTPGEISDHSQTSGEEAAIVSVEIENYYKQAIECLVRLKEVKAATPIKSRFFDQEKLFSELTFLAENVNKYMCHHEAHPGERKALDVDRRIQNEWKNLSAELGNYKNERICHRDFHSRNIKIKDENVYLIDFQDARMGSRYYDLASLLYDPYVSISDQFRDQLFIYYHEQTNEAIDLTLFQSQVIQRLLKALGTYINQVYEKKNSNFETYIMPTLKKLQSLLQSNKEYEALPYTTEWVNELSKNESLKAKQ